MSVQSVCLGWHWFPYVYTRTADDTDGAPVKPLPESLIRLARAPWSRRRTAPNSAEAIAYAPGRGDREPLSRRRASSVCIKTAKNRRTRRS